MGGCSLDAGPRERFFQNLVRARRGANASNGDKVIFSSNSQVVVSGADDRLGSRRRRAAKFAPRGSGVPAAHDEPSRAAESEEASFQERR